MQQSIRNSIYIGKEGQGHHYLVTNNWIVEQLLRYHVPFFKTVIVIQVIAMSLKHAHKFLIKTVPILSLFPKWTLKRLQLVAVVPSFSVWTEERKLSFLWKNSKYPSCTFPITELNTKKKNIVSLHTSKNKQSTF